MEPKNNENKSLDMPSVHGTVRFVKVFFIIELVILGLATVGSLGLMIDMPGGENFAYSVMAIFFLDFCAVLFALIVLNRKKNFSLIVGQIVSVINVILCLVIAAQIASGSSWIDAITFLIIPLAMLIVIIISLSKIKKGLHENKSW
ncbi:MAG: hypothetical protein WCT27_02415 [Patescibacteria group bacterium]|jgi:hypothetical protein